MTASISKLKFNPLYLHLQGPNYGLDGLNITMHTEVVIHLMNAYVWCWSKICGSLDEILSLTMGSYESKILNKFYMTLIVLNLHQKRDPKVQQDFIGQGHYDKVKSRSDHDVAQLHPLTNVPTKYQLPTPYGFQDIARRRFLNSRSLRQGQRSNPGQTMTLHTYTS